MDLIKICFISLLMARFTAGQGTDGLFNALVETIKTEVSNQMKIERKILKEEILKEIQDDREKHEETRKELERTKEGNSKRVSVIRNYENKDSVLSLKIH